MGQGLDDSDGGGAAGDRHRERREPGGDRIPPLQWAVAACGAALTVATIGYLVFLAFTSSATPPDLRVRVDSVYGAEGRWVVSFTARNLGDRTAQDVVVEAIGPEGGMGQARLDFVPGHGSRSGGLYVDVPPEAGIRVRARGWTTP